VSPEVPPLTVGLVEAMFEYLDRLENQLPAVAPTASEQQRKDLGLPNYAFRDPLIANGTFPCCSAPVKFVFISSRREKATSAGKATGWRPAGIVDDPATCREKYLCFPHLIRQHFNIGKRDVVLVRNALPYGLNHGLVRSAVHEPQSRCFEPSGLIVLLRVAQALGNRTGSSPYEAWVAGEGFNTQWHFHVQFRKQRSPVWEYLEKTGPFSNERTLLAEYPSRPVYFQGSDEDQLIRLLASEASAVRSHGDTAIGLLVSYEHAVWRALLIASRTTKRLFGKPPGLHEHLGEVILENRRVFDDVEQDVAAACQTLEAHLTEWSSFQSAG
jgi:hypothetical protein